MERDRKAPPLKMRDGCMFREIEIYFESWRHVSRRNNDKMRWDRDKMRWDRDGTNRPLWSSRLISSSDRDDLHVHTDAYAYAYVYTYIYVSMYKAACSQAALRPQAHSDTHAESEKERAWETHGYTNTKPPHLMAAHGLKASSELWTGLRERERERYTNM